MIEMEHQMKDVIELLIWNHTFLKITSFAYFDKLIPCIVGMKCLVILKLWQTKLQRSSLKFFNPSLFNQLQQSFPPWVCRVEIFSCARRPRISGEPKMKSIIWNAQTLFWKLKANILHDSYSIVNNPLDLDI